MNHAERARTFLKGALHMLGNGLEEVWKIILARKRLSAGALLLIVAALTVGSFFFRPDAPLPQDSRREVRVARVSDFSGIEPLSLIGNVRSIREAQVAPDISGAVSAIYRSLGDVVSAGTVIAELKNETQRAAVAQARAALEKAKSATGVGTIGIENAENAYTAALESSFSSIKTAYASIEDVVKRKADQTISNPNGTQPRFFIPTSNSQLALNTDSGRLAMQAILARHMRAGTPANYEAYLAEMETLIVEIDAVGAFLSNVVGALSGAIAANSVLESDIATYRLEASTALSSINALRGTVSGAVENLKAKRFAVESAQTALALGATGQSADITAAEANLASALAQLEKTIIRAPISGTINTLDLDVGSFVNASSPVVYITNPGGLEVVAYLSARDIADIVVGAKAAVFGDSEGTVVKKAQALDPLTKKAEIRLGLPANSGLVSGQSITLSIERVQRRSGEPVALSIPLAAVKITPEGPVVFSVSPEQTLMAHPVVLGTLRGTKVDIAEGITPDMIIVDDARGFTSGERVVIGE